VPAAVAASKELEQMDGPLPVPSARSSPVLERQDQRLDAASDGIAITVISVGVSQGSLPTRGSTGTAWIADYDPL